MMRSQRRGFTLVELLVVTGLLAALLGLVVGAVRRGGQQSRKPGADALAATLAAAQSRALGVPEGAGVILKPDTVTTAACDSLVNAAMLPLIQATVTGVPPLSSGSTSTSGTVTPSNSDDVLRAYKILLSGSSGPSAPWLNFVPAAGTSGTIQYRLGLGQTLGNTIWPKPLAGGTFNALLGQYPQASPSTFQFDKGTSIDLRFSGVGDDRTTFPGRFDANGSIAIVFDRAGRVVEIVPRVPDPGASVTPGAPTPAVPALPIYFLMAPRDVIVSDGNPLASSDAIWVALAPQTGRTFIAANVVQTGTDSASLQAARANAKKGITR